MEKYTFAESRLIYETARPDSPEQIEIEGFTVLDLGESAEERLDKAEGALDELASAESQEKEEQILVEAADNTDKAWRAIMSTGKENERAERAPKYLEAVNAEIAIVEAYQEKRGITLAAKEGGGSYMEELMAKMEDALEWVHETEMKPADNFIKKVLSQEYSNINQETLRDSFKDRLKKEFEFYGLEPIDENEKECRRIAEKLAKTYNGASRQKNSGERYVAQIDHTWVSSKQDKDGNRYFHIETGIGDTDTKETFGSQYRDAVRKGPLPRATGWGWGKFVGALEWTGLKDTPEENAEQARQAEAAKAKAEAAKAAQAKEYKAVRDALHRGFHIQSGKRKGEFENPLSQAGQAIDKANKRR